MTPTYYNSTATPRQILRQLGASEFDSGNDDTPRGWCVDAACDDFTTHGYLIEATDEDNSSVHAALDVPITGTFTVTRLEVTEGDEHPDQPNPNHVQRAINRAEQVTA